MGLDPDALLQVARVLSQPASKGAVKQAQIRRSISTSYYAAFSGVQRRVADAFVGTTKRSTAGYAKAFRSLEHKSIRDLSETLKAFQRSLFDAGEKQKNQRILSWLEDWRLEAISAELSDFSENFWELYAAREKADYDPQAGPYAWANAETMLRRAEIAVAALRAGKGDDWTAFSAHLVFGLRRR